MDLIPEGYKIIDKRIEQIVEFPDFQGTLRPSQQAIYDEIEDSAIINAWVSFGKTFTALAIAGLFGQKTLVVTHTVPLRNQWVREIENQYGFTPGIIGSGKFNTSTPIVVGNVQSLYKCMDRIYKTFGTVILDEMHHVSSPTFSRILDKSCARYKLGLSGTIRRKDGKHVVFKDYFGQKLFQPPKENYMTPIIHVYPSSVRLPDGASVPWAKRINAVAYNEEYQHSVAMIASAYAAKGHNVLVVSDRVTFLKKCAELVGDNATCITGEVDHEEREVLLEAVGTKGKNILFGTQSIFCEGISKNELSCIVLATPINNEPLLTQLIGRVIRKMEGKLQPVVIDINLKGNTAKRQNQERLGFYMKMGWEIKKL
jgi:superfamily II DNA or RNA helicase